MTNCSNWVKLVFSIDDCQFKMDEIELGHKTYNYLILLNANPRLPEYVHKLNLKEELPMHLMTKLLQTK